MFLNVQHDLATNMVRLAQLLAFGGLERMDSSTRYAMTLDEDIWLLPAEVAWCACIHSSIVSVIHRVIHMIIHRREATLVALHCGSDRREPHRCGSQGA